MQIIYIGDIAREGIRISSTCTLYDNINDDGTGDVRIVFTCLTKIFKLYFQYFKVSKMVIFLGRKIKIYITSMEK